MSSLSVSPNSRHSHLPFSISSPLLLSVSLPWLFFFCASQAHPKICLPQLVNTVDDDEGKQTKTTTKKRISTRCLPKIRGQTMTPQQRPLLPIRSPITPELASPSRRFLPFLLVAVSDGMRSHGRATNIRTRALSSKALVRRLFPLLAIVQGPRNRSKPRSPPWYTNCVLETLLLAVNGIRTPPFSFPGSLRWREMVAPPTGYFDFVAF